MPGLKLRAAAVVSALLVTTTGSLAATPLLAPAAAAGSGPAFLAGRLVGGNHLTNSYGDDQGLTADLALALAASHEQDPALAKVVGWLTSQVVPYADPAGTTAYPGPYSGAAGKLALVAEATGQDPHSFGGFDLLATLTGHVCTAARPDGSCTAAGDFYQSYSSISQSLAVLALARGGVTPPAAAVTRLEQLQCADGGFSSELVVPPAACSSDADATGYAVQALSLLPGTAAVLGTARDYLLTTQQPDGGYTGAAGENANSTALAAQALTALAGVAGLPASTVTPVHADPVTAARAFLTGLQQPDGGYLINPATPGSDVRSTTQAVPALAGAILTTVSDPVTAVSPTVTPTPTASASGSARPSSSAPAGVPAATSAAAVPPAPAAATGGEVLASTGARSRQPLLAGLGLVLAGGLALLLARRPRGRRG
ncbi:MAG TPA: prenyltransferase/squalene oxidase repeat-containing protein [Jatrophihabitans sp.]|nr:prenyltransferase/squalene oxidase repeat-containing protein [Jatrophihabitans sp.]